MASSSGSDSNKQVEVCLTEDDIPGAVLQPPFERHTVSELRFWLLCRGVTVAASMKKSQIIGRYVTCRNAHKLLLMTFTEQAPFFVCRIHDVIQEKKPIVDVDGTYLFRKLHSSGVDLSSMPLPSLPINGWESITSDNVTEMSSKVPVVTSGMKSNRQQ